MNSLTRSINIKYSLAQAGYWMSLCAISSCAAVFLQSRGYSNSQLGLVVALGNGTAFILSPMLGGVIDRSEKIDSKTMLWILMLMQGAFILALYALPQHSLLLSFCYCAAVALNTSRSPILTSLCMELNRAGGNINYGVARGIGSLAYAISAAVLGNLIEIFSASILITAGVVLSLFQMGVLCLFKKSETPADSIIAEHVTEKSSGMLKFIRENPGFCILMCGVALQFFAHNLTCNFIINVVRNVGGNAADMGNISAFMAGLELPAMFFYSKISKRFGCSKCVRFAVVFFAVKVFAVALAASVGSLYAAHVFQAFSYALLTPALVEYVELNVPHKDSARGQAVSYAMITMGSILASLFGGMMYDALPVRSVLFIGACFSVMGMVISLLSAKRDTANT